MNTGNDCPFSLRIDIPGIGTIKIWFRITNGHIRLDPNSVAELYAVAQAKSMPYPDLVSDFVRPRLTAAFS